MKITVAEYHDLTGISKKTIYKKINQGKLETTQGLVNNRLTTFVICDEEDLPLLPDSPRSKLPVKPKETQEKSEETELPLLPDSPRSKLPVKPNEQILQTLTLTIEMLQKQLDEKDNQIRKLHELLDQEQQLNAQNNLLLSDNNRAAPAVEEQNQKQKKKKKKK